MKKEIICYGVRDYEVSYFTSLGEKYSYNLILREPFLTNENYKDAFGHPIVMVRGNCFLNKNSLTELKENGLTHLLTRSVGVNHIDVNACKELGIKVANVPGYSPNAISELALTLAMMLLRNTAYITNRTSEKNFIITNQMFSREIRNCTVGIIGCGRIGLTTAKLFKGLGAKVIGYDVYQNDYAKEILEYVSLEELQKNSDVISIHMPFIKGVNEKLINKEFIANMKDNSILVNTARGEIHDIEALVEAVESNKLAGVAIDVLDNEREVFFQEFNEMPNEIYSKMVSLYPKFLVTPHIGASTDEALTNMIEISLENMEEYLNTNSCKNEC